MTDATAGDGIVERIRIDAPPDAVWAVLTEPRHLARWMNGADVRSTWLPGAAIEIEHVLEGRTFHDRGTVLDAVPGRRLRYSLWSEVSRLPDTEANRSRITFDLEAVDGGATVLVVHQEHPGRRAAAAHWRFWWPVALGVIRDLAEGRAPTSPLLRVDA